MISAKPSNAEVRTEMTFPLSMVTLNVAFVPDKMFQET